MIHTWKNLDSLNQLNLIEETSTKKTAVIFKHSTRCGISLHAMHKLESDWDLDERDVDFYYLDLLNNRAISNEIANRFGVVHQSPQIIVIKNGKATYDISHNGISVEVVKSKI